MKSHIFISIVSIAVLSSFAQTEITNDSWFSSGQWKTDPDLVQLYSEIESQIKGSIPIDPGVLDASNALYEKQIAALNEKAREFGFKLDKNGNPVGKIDENGNIIGKIESKDEYLRWDEATKQIRDEFNAASAPLWSSWKEEFAKRTEEAFIEAARNLKINSEKMK